MEHFESMTTEELQRQRLISIASQNEARIAEIDAILKKYRTASPEATAYAESKKRELLDAYSRKDQAAIRRLQAEIEVLPAQRIVTTAATTTTQPVKRNHRTGKWRVHVEPTTGERIYTAVH